MSQRAVKATNRQIRRAFGEEALDTVNQQGQVLQSVVLPRLMTLGKELPAMANRIDALEAARAEQSRWLLAWQGMTRWQRFRWLVGI